MTKDPVGDYDADKSLNTADTVKLPAELLDALDDTQITFTPMAKSNVAAATFVKAEDTAKLAAEVLDALDDAVQITFTPMPYNTRPTTIAPIKPMFEAEPLLNEEDTARVRPPKE